MVYAVESLKSFENAFAYKKISIFACLSWDNKIPVLENLEVRRRNKFPTTSCVLYHAVTELKNHLFFQCSFPLCIWDFFCCFFYLPWLTNSLENLGPLKATWDLLARAIVWSICLEHNAYIFNSICYHLVQSYWEPLNAYIVVICSSKAAKCKLNGLINLAKHSLDFLSPMVERRAPIIQTIDQSTASHITRLILYNYDHSCSLIFYLKYIFFV